MTITLSPELEAALEAAATSRGTEPENLVVETLHSCFLPRKPEPMSDQEWIEGLRAAAIDCGTYLTDEDMSREVIYD